VFFQVLGSLAVTRVLVVSVIQHARRWWWLHEDVVTVGFILLNRIFLLLCDGMYSEGDGSMFAQNLWIFCISYKAVMLVHGVANSHMPSISVVVIALVCVVL